MEIRFNENIPHSTEDRTDRMPMVSRIQSMQSQSTDSFSSRFDPAQRLSPTAFEQNATMRDSSLHEDRVC